jgi:hypothetical protein
MFTLHYKLNLIKELKSGRLGDIGGVIVNLPHVDTYFWLLLKCTAEDTRTGVLVNMYH